MTAETDIAAIDDGGANTAAEVRTALTSVLGRADLGSLPTPSAKGDIAVYDGTAWVVVSSGANDQVLTADSAETAGVKWATPSGGGLNRTLEYSDATNDATEITVAAGTAAYDAGEDAIKVNSGGRIYYAQAAVQLSNLGDWYDVELDAKPNGTGGILNFLTAYENAGWDAYMFRVDYRTGGRFYEFLRANGGTWLDAGGPQLRGPQTGGTHQGFGWLPLMFGRRGDMWYFGVRVANGFPPMMLTAQTHTEYTSGSAVGVHAESGSDFYFRNVRVYSYATDPTVP